MKILSLLTLFTLFSPIAHSETETVFAFKVKSLTGKPVPLTQYEGKVLMIVNTASHCGFTPQYAGLQAIYKEYKAKGFEILAFPSNDFGSQEPGDAKEIKNFCDTKYKISFPLFQKGAVAGPHKQALYQWLITHEPNAQRIPTELEWNFEKFIISRDGKVAARFPPKVTPQDESVRAAIEAALAAPVPPKAKK